MASTKRPTLQTDPRKKDLVVQQIEQFRQQLEQKLEQYKTQSGEIYPLLLVEGNVEVEEVKYDFINPSHYVQDDGRQTWEHMVDKWGAEKTALWCEMTAYKYQDRIGRKPGEDHEREMKKIKWYEEKAEELRKVAKKKKFW